MIDSNKDFKIDPNQMYKTLRAEVNELRITTKTGPDNDVAVQIDIIYDGIHLRTLPVRVVKGDGSTSISIRDFRAYFDVVM